MKKFITIMIATIVAMVAFSSCHKMEDPVEYATVTFGYQMVESNSMVSTKAFTNTDIVDFIKSKLDTTFTISLKSNTTGLTYSATMGKSVTIPIDTYSVSYEKNSGWVSAIPSFKISDTNIIISKDTKSYTLNATYTCYAVIIDLEEVNSAIATGPNSAYTNVSGSSTYDGIRTTKGTMGLAFCRNWATFTLSVDSSSSFEKTTINFVSTYSKGNTLYEYGKYYIIHPNVVDKSNSTFNVTYPDWEQGDL